MRLITARIHNKVRTLRIPFRHSGHAHTQSHCLQVEIRTDKHQTFLGEVQTRPYLTGETLESAQAYIETMMLPRLLLSDFSEKDSLKAILEDLHLRADCSRHLAAYCAVEWAILQAFSHHSGEPIVDLVRGLFPGAPPLQSAGSGHQHLQMTALPLLASPWAEGLSLFLRCLGNRVLKMKISTELLSTQLAQARREKWLFSKIGLDANGCMEPEIFLRRSSEFQQQKFDFIEQPTSKANEHHWPRISNETGSAVIADESLCSLDDAKRLLNNPGCGGWNLRLAKNGGFQGIHKLLAQSKGRNLDLHLGSLVGETEILEEAFFVAARVYSFTRIEPPHSKWLLQSR